MTALYITIPIYLAIVIVAAVAWLKGKLPTVFTAFVVVTLTFITIVFGVVLRSQQQQDARNDKACADVQATARALNSFGDGVKSFIEKVEERLQVRLKDEKKGSEQYAQDEEAIVVYRNLVNSINSVRVTECKLVTNKKK